MSRIEVGISFLEKSTDKEFKILGIEKYKILEENSELYVMLKSGMEPAIKFKYKHLRDFETANKLDFDFVKEVKKKVKVEEIFRDQTVNYEDPWMW